MLEEDGRRPFNEIAAALDVSEGTIRNRVNAMRQANQIKIVAITDAGAVEYNTNAMNSWQNASADAIAGVGTPASIAIFSVARQPGKAR